MIKKYIKKQSPIEAVQWDGSNVEEIRSFYTRKYRGARNATSFSAPNLNDYIVFEDKFFKIVSKDRFEAEYVQLDEDHTLKYSDLFINNAIRNEF